MNWTQAQAPASAPVLDLFGRTITAIEIKGRGALEATFDGNLVLHVGPDPHYESWHLTGTGIAPITVGPGGETDWQTP
jgi:hypothetical protein